ncbi:MAG: fibronectin type III domain-containing protein, partial [bacterium]
QDITYTPKNDQIGNDIIEICLTDGKEKNRFSIPITISAVDSKFANGGQINLGSTLTAQHRITLLENGKIRLAFGADDQSRRILSIRQFLEDGAVDTSFGAEGQVNFTSNSLDSNIYSAISNSIGDIYAVGHAGPLNTASGIVLKLPSGQKQAVLGAQKGIGPIFFPSLVNETHLLGQTTTAVVGGGLGNLLTDKFKNVAYGTSTTTNYATLSNNQFAVSTLNTNSSDLVLSSLSVTRYQMSNETPSQTNVDNISSISNVSYLVPVSTAFLDTTPATLIVGFRGSADVSYCARYGYVGGGAICGGNGGCYFPTQCMATSYRRELTASKGFYLVSISGSEVKLLGDPVYTDLNDVKSARKGPDGIYINSGNTMYKITAGNIRASWYMDLDNMVDFAVDSRGRILVLKKDGSLTRYLRPASSMMPVTTPTAPALRLPTYDYFSFSYIPESRAELSWDAPASNGGDWITDYVVQYSSNNGSTWTTFDRPASAARWVNVTGLTETQYVFRVAAKNSAGIGSFSQTSTTVSVRQPRWSEVTVGSDITMRSRATGIWLSNTRGWMDNRQDAQSHCESLSYNGQTDWRLPTQNELIEAYQSTPSPYARDGWISRYTMENTAFWSTTSSLNLANGRVGVGSMYQVIKFAVVCVRQQ